MYDVTIKRGDTRTCIKAVLKDARGAPVDLTDCSVSFHMVPLSRPFTVSRAAHIQDAAAGEVWFVWAPGDTDTAGVYRAELEVVYQDGRKETYPNDGYISIQMLDDLRRD